MSRQVFVPLPTRLPLRLSRLVVPLIRKEYKYGAGTMDVSSLTTNRNIDYFVLEIMKYIYFVLKNVETILVVSDVKSNVFFFFLVLLIFP